MFVALSPFTPPQFLMAAIRSSLGSDLTLPARGSVSLLTSPPGGGGGGGGAGVEEGGAIGGRHSGAEADLVPLLVALLSFSRSLLPCPGGGGARDLPCLPVLGLDTVSSTTASVWESVRALE